MRELIDVDAIAVDRDVIFSGRDIAIKGAAVLGDPDDRAVQSRLGDVGRVFAIEPDPRRAGRNRGDLDGAGRRQRGAARQREHYCQQDPQSEISHHLDQFMLTSVCTGYGYAE